MRSSKAVLLQSPTGSGKTAMAIYMISNAIRKCKRIVFTVPRKELLNQTSESFDEYDIEHSFIAAGQKYEPFVDAHIGMIPTMANRLDTLPDADLIIFDETHYGTNQLDSVINHYKNKGSYIVGLSATPWKSSGQGLGMWYDDIVEGKSIEWLIQNKRLSDYRPFAPSTPDLSGLKITGGDYAKGELASFMEQESAIIGDAVKHYKAEAMGKLHMVFCSSIKHSQIVAESFKSQGIPAAHIDGNTPPDERKRLIRAYAKREIMVMTNCDLLCFGFDLSQASGMDVCIESMSDLKPTKSLALQMQKWGRVLRYKDQPAIIFDHANNFKEHGLPCSDRDWTLNDRVQKKTQSEPAPPTKQCENCFYVHPPAPHCPSCGTVYKIKPREVKEFDGELEELMKDKARYQAKIEQAKCRDLESLIQLGKQRGYKNPRFWAKKVYAARKKGKYYGQK